MPSIDLKNSKVQKRLFQASEAQARAVRPDQSVWVQASAGTGKTKVLIDRVLALLLEGVPPSKILGLTFTKAAAAEMENRLQKELSTWVTLSEEELQERLKKFTGVAASKQKCARARQLFAAVLDVQGGMKIQTIHAFCQSVLGRFPLEIGISPHFQALDERQALALQAVCEEEVLKEGFALPNSLLGEALRRLLPFFSSRDTFQKLLKALLQERSRFWALTKDLPQTREAFKRAYGITRSLEAVQADFLSVEEDRLRQIGKVFVQDAVPANQKAGQNLLKWLSLESHERLASIPLMFHFFFTAKNVPRKKPLGNKKLKAQLPGYEDFCVKEAQRLLDLFQESNAQELFLCACDLLTLGSEIITRYESKKSAQAQLDFEDMILKTRDLLQNQGSWVMYKLDQGVDHILLDEAQDTNPEQWQIIQALIEEFFASDVQERSLFVVGDDKQSIFGFQRADPAVFEEMHSFFEQRLKQAEQSFEYVDMRHSFRSSEAVLSFVNHIFSEAPRLFSQREGQAFPSAEAVRLGQYGKVTLWPPVFVEKVKEESSSASSGKPYVRVSAQAILAQKIAEEIEERCQKGTASAGDFLVLVPKRGPFVRSLVAQLKKRAIPIAGEDRLKLADQLAIQDLVSLIRFVLNPSDDLSLAEVLRSPLGGLSEEQLFTLSWKRKGSLWQALKIQGRPEEETKQERKEETLLSSSPMFESSSPFEGSSPQKSVWAFLDRAIRRRDHSPFDFLSFVLEEEKKRYALKSRLGEEIEDPLEEFVTLTLEHEQQALPTLQNFLSWFTVNEDIQVKRELDQSQGQVRIMTVHGSKGLQAPIVILAGTTAEPTAREMLLWIPQEKRGGIPQEKRGGIPQDRQDGGEKNPPLFVWCPNAEMSESLVSTAKDQAKERALAEHQRLLYVALTRAEDELILTGWKHSEKGETKEAPFYGKEWQGNSVERNLSHEKSWYAQLEAGFKQLLKEGTAIETQTPAGAGVCMSLGEFQKKGTSVDQETEQEEPVPQFFYHSVPKEPVPSTPLRPSHLHEEKRSLSPLKREDKTGLSALEKGSLVHRLIETVLKTPFAQGQEKQQAFLWIERFAPHLTKTEKEYLVQQVLNFLSSSFYEEMKTGDYFVEAPLVGQIGKTVVSGRIDLLVRKENEILIFDFKTGQRYRSVPQTYVRQMALYWALLRQIDPAKKIRAALLWVEDLTIEEILEEQMTQSLEGL